MLCVDNSIGLNYKEIKKQIKMTVNSTIAHQRLSDRERFKEILKRRLIECGWRDQVRKLCRDAVEGNHSNESFDGLLTKVIPRAQALLPESVKKELVYNYEKYLLTQKDQ